MSYIDENSSAEQAWMVHQQEKQKLKADPSLPWKRYLDEYETRHEAMRLLSNAWWETDDQRIKGIITRAVNHVRDAAMQLIPYGATTPNKTWDGRRA